MDSKRKVSDSPKRQIKKPTIHENINTEEESDYERRVKRHIIKAFISQPHPKKMSQDQ